MKELCEPEDDEGFMPFMRKYFKSCLSRHFFLSQHSSSKIKNGMNQNICFCSEPLNVNGAPPFYSLGASKSPVNMQGKRAKSNSFHVNERQTSCVTMKSHKKMDKYTIQSMWSQDTFAWPSICMTSREVFSGDSRAFKNCAE